MLLAPFEVSTPEFKHPTVITHRPYTNRFQTASHFQSYEVCSQCNRKHQQFSSANMISKMN
ncbi:hypothetical protein GBA52_016363 [Prunus armeniaca]|nr:hypothetical protein GBA52_016363 [Prunus armeniaca]